MFKQADRLPFEAPADGGVARAVRPWGLQRMAPFAHTVHVGIIATRIDPVTQLGADDEGVLVEAKHKRSNTGTESRTRTAKGDGQHQGYDEDHGQDSDQD
ncbi:putative ATP-grasp-modified RiPP [Actinomadura formosensis]|uniref:putative ATP-grasp-modified RiPP n=2 Tax=Actinomadura formosensis TaxID=60706 RepID=UPI00082958AC